MAEAIALAHIVKVSCRRSHRIRDVGFMRSLVLEVDFWESQKINSRNRNHPLAC
ncbi:hypothetical protein [Tolypothrix sp. VBCCA 56010]|uniref:hypothetical protein n=1 Tax=Tolypothrix sp. VBCCA 56010 TaxID=3137731 RepID=UPI003D7CD2F5